MGPIFSDITSSGLITLLQQYNTPVSGGTGQTFGNGTFGGLFQIVPSSANNGSTITDTQIQSELLAQITAPPQACLAESMFCTALCRICRQVPVAPPVAVAPRCSATIRQLPATN